MEHSKSLHQPTKSWLYSSLIFTLIAVAFLLRFWNIETLPSGLYPDEAVNAIDAIHANETGTYQLFYPNNNGREGLFINLQALALKVFGLEIWSLKLFSILFGTLTVWGIYLLAHELWRKRSVALGATFFMAFSYWAINFSRIGFRAIMVPFLLVFALYFFLRGLRTKQLSPFILSGLLFGTGLHTYIAFRVAPLILIIFVVGLMLSYQHFLRLYWKHALVFICGAFITAAPMFYTFATHPEYFSSRSTSISIFSPEVNHGNLLQTLSKTLSLSLIKYNFWGDPNWRHNYPPYPILDPFTGIFFLAGLLFLVPRTIHLLIRRLRDHDRNRELAICFLLLGWLLTMLIPEFLTDEGLPHALRAIGTQPAVFLIAALPLLWISERYTRSGPSTKMLYIGLLSTLFLIIGIWNTTKYFYFFANNPNQHGAFNQNFTAMSQYLLTLPSESNKYVYANAGGTTIDNGLPVTAQPIIFLTYNKVQHLSFIKPNDPLSLTAPATIVLMSYDESFINKVRTVSPNSSLDKVDLYPNMPSDFYVIRIPKL